MFIDFSSIKMKEKREEDYIVNHHLVYYDVWRIHVLRIYEASFFQQK